MMEHVMSADHYGSTEWTDAWFPSGYCGSTYIMVLKHTPNRFFITQYSYLTHEYNVLAGPFESFEIAEVAYNLLVDDDE